MRTDLPSDCERLLSCLLQALNQSHPVHRFPAQEPRSSGAGTVPLHCSSLPWEHPSSASLLLSNLSLKSQVYPWPWHLTLYHSYFLLHLFSLVPKVSFQTVHSGLPWAWDTQSSDPSTRALGPQVILPKRSQHFPFRLEHWNAVDLTCKNYKLNVNKAKDGEMGRWGIL